MRRIFESNQIGSVPLKNRLLRSAIFEGACDPQGFPTPHYRRVYESLADAGLGAIITGFTFVSSDGKAMQPGQAGMESDAKIAAFKPVTAAVHQGDIRIFLQLAHTGRQTTSEAVSGRVRGVSAQKSWYFPSVPDPYTTAEVARVVDDFGHAARRARAAGFDGVQVHAAHGYLVHQFLHPAINNRSDRYGLDSHSGIGTRFLEEVLDSIRTLAGRDYPVLVKVSAGDNYRPKFTSAHFVSLVRFLDSHEVSAIEVSYGTMDYAFNIFRGVSFPAATLLAHNPRFATTSPLRRALLRFAVFPALRLKFRPFRPAYNLRYALLAKASCSCPIIAVGGFRAGQDIRQAVEEHGLDYVALGRAVLCETGFARRLESDPYAVARCINCNCCAVMCDSGRATRCYHPLPEPAVPRVEKLVYEYGR